MLILLASLALAQPTTCLTADEVRSRILEPLHALERCQREVEILTGERDGLHAATSALAVDLADAQSAQLVAERRAKRARRGQTRAAGAGAGATLVVVLLLLVML